jgi:hypothetical protein
MARTKETKAPSLSLLVLCDGAVRDPNSGKMTLYGLFDRVICNTLPGTSHFTIYAKLVGGTGKHEIGIQILDPSDKPMSLEAPIPTMPVECKEDANIEANIVSVVTFKKLGVYSVQVVLNGKPMSPFRSLKVEKAVAKEVKP